MNNQTANVDFYLGALGPHGFCGYFDRLCQEPDRQMYLIKSGPGCGKSTMMRKIAEASPLPVQRIHCSSDPDSLDGVILVAFLLGWPANEIVIPIILMAYLSQGSLLEYESLAQLHTLLAANGWSWLTAACVLLFCLFHWPCSTTLLTVRRETGSWRWTALAAALPTALGVAACTLLCTFVHILGLN